MAYDWQKNASAEWAKNLSSGSAATSAAISAANADVDYMKKSVDAAQKEYENSKGWANLISAANTAIQKNYENMNSDASALRNMGDAALAALLENASTVNADASRLRSMADSMWNTGTGLLSVGQDILNLNTSSGNDLVSKYANWVRSIDPDRYVAMAVADTQAAHENAYGQMIRNMTRAGADASSTKTAAFQRSMMQTLTAALAGAKTRARQQGQSDMGAALSAALAEARQWTEQGLKAQTSGLEGQTQAGNLAAKAGDQIAEGYKLQITARSSAADVEKAAASLQDAIAKNAATAASITTDAAKVLVAAYGNVDSAYKALVSAQSNAADYFAKLNSSIASMSAKNMKTLFSSYGDSGGGGGSSGGYTIRYWNGKGSVTTTTLDSKGKTISQNTANYSGKK